MNKKRIQFIFFMIVLIFTSCSKYEYGNFSLKTPEDRLIEDTWFSNVLISKGKEHEITDNYNVKFKYFTDRKGSYTFNTETNSYIGEVRLEENKTKLVFFKINEYADLDTITSSIFNSWKINKLTNEELWIETNIENVDVEIKFYRK